MCPIKDTTRTVPTGYDVTEIIGYNLWQNRGEG